MDRYASVFRIGLLDFRCKKARDARDQHTYLFLQDLICSIFNANIDSYFWHLRGVCINNNQFVF